MLTFIDAIGFWISLLAGLAAYAWPQFILPGSQRFPEEHLCQISPRFRGITRTILVYDIITFLLMMAGLLAVIYLPSIQSAVSLQAGRLAWPAVLLAFLGIAQGLFAVWRGVYPVSRYRGRGALFAYAEGDKMKMLGQQQILYALIVIVVALLAGWLRLQAG